MQLRVPLQFFAFSVVSQSSSGQGEGTGGGGPIL
jgi:hypothetical protein